MTSFPGQHRVGILWCEASRQTASLFGQNLALAEDRERLARIDVANSTSASKEQRKEQSANLLVRAPLGDLGSHQASQMIVDTLGNIDRYAVLGSRFAIGIGFVKRLKLPLHETRIELDGDNVVAMVQHYAPQGVESRSFEAHRAFADIQFLARGEEIIYYSPLPRLRQVTEYSAASDSALFTGPDDQPIIMMPQSFAIFFPYEGHKPGCILRNEETVTKIVVKVRV